MAVSKLNLDKFHIVCWNIQRLRAKYQEQHFILSEIKIFQVRKDTSCVFPGDSLWGYAVTARQTVQVEKCHHLTGENNRGVSLLMHGTLQCT